MGQIERRQGGGRSPACAATPPSRWPGASCRRPKSAHRPSRTVAASKHDAREASRKERATAAGRTRAPAGPPLRNGVARARRSAAAPLSGSQGLHDRSGAQSSGSTSVIASTARAGGCARPRLRRSKWCRVLAGALLPRCLARIVLASRSRGWTRHDPLARTIEWAVAEGLVTRPLPGAQRAGGNRATAASDEVQTGESIASSD